MADATFTVNGSDVTGAVAVAAESEVALAVVDTTGVRATIDWQFVGNHHSSATNPTITKSGVPLGSTATFTMPAGPNQAYMIRCRIDDGVDVNGRTDSAATYRAIIGVHNNNSVVPTCFGEERERNSTHGTTEIFNFLLNLQGSGVTNLYASDINNDTTLTGDNLQEVLDGLDSDDITNASTVTGTTVSDALDTLAAADTTINTTISNLGTDDITNESSVTGVTASDALDNLATQAITDHGALTGLGDVADHTGYLTLDGARAMAGDLDMSENAVGDASYLEVPTTEHIGGAKSVAGIGAVRLGFSGDIVMRNYDDDNNLVLFGISSSGGDVFVGAEAEIRAGSTNRTILRAYGGLYLQSGGPVNRMTITQTQATLEVPLSMGTNNILTNGLVDGVDVSAHASRHLPGGADPLPLGTSDISNESSIFGETTTDALNSLATQTGTIVTSHGALTGLDEVADHTGYLVLDGSRWMTGTLNMGGNNIVTNGLVDGVDVSAHAARHLPGGADPLPLVTDHGALTGRGDDDHTHYWLADGSRDVGGNVTFSGTHDIATTGARFGTAFGGAGDFSSYVAAGSGTKSSTGVFRLPNLGKISWRDGGAGDVDGIYVDGNGYVRVGDITLANQILSDTSHTFALAGVPVVTVDTDGIQPAANKSLGSSSVRWEDGWVNNVYLASSASLQTPPALGAVVSNHNQALTARNQQDGIKTLSPSDANCGGYPVLCIERQGVVENASSGIAVQIELPEILEFVPADGSNHVNRFAIELTIEHNASALSKCAKYLGQLIVVWNTSAGNWEVDTSSDPLETIAIAPSTATYTDHSVAQYDDATTPTLELTLSGGSNNVWFWHVLIRGIVNDV